MHLVRQERLYEGPDQRGSCEQACVASIFEIDHDEAPAIGQDTFTWTSRNFPGVGFARRSLPAPTNEPPDPSVGTRAIWIAGIHTQTEGFTDSCGRCWEYEGNEHGDPLPGRPPLCPWCGEQWGLEKGTRPGYHAVVMLGIGIAWDPHPDGRADDLKPEELWFVDAAWWTVTDPGRLVPRQLPRRLR